MNQGKRGSEWHKWDLHLHTRSSYDYDYNNDDAESLLVKKLRENSVKAVAITDHFVIDKERIEKLRALAPDIVFFPGVEIRTDKGSTNIHVIVIFSNKIDLKSLEEDLKSFIRNPECTENSNNVETMSCDFNQILKFTKQHNGIISIHAGNKSNGVDDKISNAVKFNEARKECYAQNIDIFEMGKIKDCVDYEKNVFTDKFFLDHGKKPMIICSDNHDPRKYKLEENSTWIKSELTFEGLKQILFEPDDRVKIQKEEPDYKTEYNVIDYIECIEDDTKNFQKEKIYFNKNLNCIIGGKSTGKSLLLYKIAETCNEEEIKKRYRDRKQNYKEINSKFKISWKNNEENGGKVIYIPQSYLINIFNKQIDEDIIKVKDEVNKFIIDLLKSNSKIERMFNDYDEKTKHNEEEINRTIEKLCSIINEIKKEDNKLQNIGNSKKHQQEIKKIENQIKEYGIYENIGKEIEKYNINKTEISNCKEKEFFLQQKISAIANFSNPKIIIEELAETLNEKYIEDGYGPKVYNNYPNNEYNDIKELIENLQNEIISKWHTEINIINENTINILQKIKKKREDLENEQQELSNSVNINDEIKILNERLFEEKNHNEEACQLENSIKIKRKNMIDLKNELDEKYNNFEKINEDLKNEFTNNISVYNDEEKEFKIEFNKNLLKYTDLSHYIDNRNLNSFDKINLKEGVERNIKNINIIYDNLETTLKRKVDYSLIEIIKYLYCKPCEISFDIFSDGDSLYKVSPGKQAKIMLDLLINFSNDKYPVLIDQPEDDLDNRSIYKDLVEYIKKKKKTRQFIVVTHNANVVIGADAEEIIIANQDSVNAKNEEYKFEYRIGSIEDNTIININSRSILKNKAFREQVCDILEGGKEAFKSREEKYNIKDIK